MKIFEKLFRTYDSVIFFDTETTGLDCEKDQIINLAAVRYSQAENDNGFLPTKTLDRYVRLPEGRQLPEKIIELTGITDRKLAADGTTEKEVAEEFAEMFEGRTLLVAHNIQFDLQFIADMLQKYGMGIEGCDYLDTLTVFKDRAAYPHKLSNAIEHYNLDGKVVNSHRAVDDVIALSEVAMEMAKERNDLADYVNLFGFNPKYGIYGKMLDKVIYIEQPYHDGGMLEPENTLASIAVNFQGICI